MEFLAWLVIIAFGAWIIWSIPQISYDPWARARYDHESGSWDKTHTPYVVHVISFYLSLGIVMSAVYVIVGCIGFVFTGHWYG
jgi:hypothetical protein